MRDRLNRRTFLLGLAGLGMLSWRLQDAEAYQPFDPFTFAFISDVHLANDLPDSYILVRESQLFLQELVKELNAEKPDFVLFGGDQVETVGKDEANWNLFTDVVQGLNSPWSFILGDRDVSGQYPVDKIRTYASDWKARGIETDTSYWSHNPSGFPNVHLVGLDTSIPNTTVGGMSRKQLNWLKDDLEAHKQFFTIVFAHHPLLPPPPFDGGPPWDDYTIPDSGSAREILGAYPNVKMVVSGHVYVSKVQVEKDIWHISSPALAVWPCAYRIFRVTPQMVTMETRQIEFPALVKKAKKALAESALADRYSRTAPASFLDIVEGSREDQDALIPMTPGKQLQPYNPKKVHRKEEPPAAQEEKHHWFKKKTEPEAAPSQKRGASRVRTKKNSGEPRTSETPSASETKTAAPAAEPTNNAPLNQTPTGANSSESGSIKQDNIENSGAK